MNVRAARFVKNLGAATVCGGLLALFDFGFPTLPAFAVLPLIAGGIVFEIYAAYNAVEMFKDGVDL